MIIKKYKFLFWKWTRIIWDSPKEKEEVFKNSIKNIDNTIKEIRKQQNEN
jgi:hypothetical protein